MLRSPDTPNTPSNGGWNLAEAPCLHTGQKEAAKIGNLSNRRSRMPRDRSSMTKSKKLRTKVVVHRSWWTRSRRENFLLSKPSSTTINLVSPQRVFGMLFTTHSTLRFIIKSTLKFLTNSSKNCLKIGVSFPNLSSYQRLAVVLTHLHLVQTGWLGAIGKTSSKTTPVFRMS